MKKSAIAAVLTFILTACDTFGYQPQPFPVWSPIPSRTPSVITATPIILMPPFTETPLTTIPGPTLVPSTLTETPTGTPTSTIEPSFTPSLPETVQVEILGCNTSLDVSHGMGEVTNAYVIVRNSGNADLPNTCALLRAIDEDREHPDKQVCIDNLPAQSQVTFKLTVDSEYKQDTAIQVDATSGDILILRVDRGSCADIGLFGGAPPNIGTVEPIR